MNFIKVVPRVFYRDLSDGLKLFVDCLQFNIVHQDLHASQPSIGIRKFTYQNGLLKSIVRSVDDPNFRPTETVFLWSDGNIIQTDLYYFLEGERRFNGNRMFTYDHGVNYLNQDMAFIYTEGTGEETKVSKNNVVTQQTKFGDDIYQGGYYTFTYTKSGYPTGYVYNLGEAKYTPIKIRYW